MRNEGTNSHKIGITINNITDKFKRETPKDWTKIHTAQVPKKYHRNSSQRRTQVRFGQGGSAAMLWAELKELREPRTRDFQLELNLNSTR